MNYRSLLGSCLSYFYNHWISCVPSRTIRHAYLRIYLGAWGTGSAVQMNCRFWNGRKVRLGARNVINYGCLLDGRKYQIVIGDDVSIGPEASILTLSHDTQGAGFEDRGAEVVIGNHVWIAYRAIVLPGVSIGEGAVVAAGAVVTRDVAPFTIVAGVPAKVVGQRTKELSYRLSHAPFLQ